MIPEFIIDGLQVVKDSNDAQNHIINRLRNLQYCTITDKNDLANFDNAMIALTISAHRLHLRCKRINYERSKHILGGYRCSFGIGSDSINYIAHLYIRPLKGSWKGDEIDG